MWEVWTLTELGRVCPIGQGAGSGSIGMRKSYAEERQMMTDQTVMKMRLRWRNRIIALVMAALSLSPAAAFAGKVKLDVTVIENVPSTAT
jgi:hypothetical protein